MPVFAAVASPIESGVVASIARPGDNRISAKNLATDLRGKRLQVLKEAFPRLSIIGVLNSDQSVSAFLFAEVRRESTALDMEVLPLQLHCREDFEERIAMMRKACVDAIYPLDNAINGQLRNLHIAFVFTYRLPVNSGSRQFMDVGGLMSYATYLNANFRSVTTFVDKTLRGAKPVDYPVERPSKFEFLLSWKTTKKLDVKFRNSILARTDKVIE